MLMVIERFWRESNGNICLMEYYNLNSLVLMDEMVRLKSKLPLHLTFDICILIFENICC